LVLICTLSTPTPEDGDRYDKGDDAPETYLHAHLANASLFR
jgi:hypothetical protein